MAYGPLTLPFVNQNTALLQGWLYDGPWGPDGTNYHGALDYATPYGTTIRAATDGYAWTWTHDVNSNYSWGNYVVVYDPSSGVYTLYAHLDSAEGFIPRSPQAVYSSGTGVPISRGQRIGWSGSSGTTSPHLHFEVSLRGINGYPGMQRVDPFGVYSQAWDYPGNCSGTIYWTSCPPVPSGQQTSCTSPGTYVDIANAADCNGDGKQEFVRFYVGPGRWDVALSSGHDFTPLKNWFCGLGKNSVSQMLGDINGDGRDDAVILDKNTNGNVFVSTSTGSRFNNYYQAASGIMKNMTNRFLEDVNGDGKDDMIGWVNGKWYVSLSNGFAFGPMALGASASVIPNRRFVADVNGDGKADAIIYYPWGDWWVAKGKADGKFTGWVRWDTGHCSGSSERFVADINGDGRGDAICYWNNVAPGWQGKIIAHHSTGFSFSKDNTPRAIGHGTNSQRQLFGDFTGDGKADFGFWYPSSGWWVSKGDGWGFLVPTRW